MPPDLLHRGIVKTEIGSSPNRIAALDFTKGALVLFMVLYHWLGYFQGQHGSVFRYLRFLPPSFIFIAGFLISNVYFAKHKLTDPRLPKRLVSRGAKILAVFVLLNVAISFVFTGFRNLSVDDLWAVYVTGNVYIAGTGKAAAFYVLVPISYLLFLSAVLLVACRFYKYTFYVACALSFTAIFALDLQGLKSTNLELVTIGLLGLIVGYTPIERVNSFVRHPYLLTLAYLCYAFILTKWEPNYIGQVAGVCLTLMLIYLLGTISTEPATVQSQIILLGRYSLFGYIAQIAILQLLRRALLHSSLGSGGLVLSFVSAVALTVAAVVIMDRCRSKSAAIDKFYKWIFA
jgi:peptidoglycan/LPS O-acetylase OafA/YrhL